MTAPPLIIVLITLGVRGSMVCGILGVLALAFLLSMRWIGKQVQVEDQQAAVVAAAQWIEGEDVATQSLFSDAIR